MMTDESSENSRHEASSLLGVAVQVCACASYKVINRIHESACVRPTVKSSKAPPDPGNGNLPGRSNSLREATESARVSQYVVT